MPRRIVTDLYIPEVSRAADVMIGAFALNDASRFRRLRASLRDAGNHRAIEPRSPNRVARPGGPIIPTHSRRPHATPHSSHRNRAAQGAHDAGSELFARRA